MAVSRLLPVWKNIFNGEVQPNSEILLDRKSLSSFLTGRYIIEILNPTSSKLRTIEVSSIKKADNTIADIAFNRIGEAIDVEINTEIDATDVVLKIRNNENSLISVSVTKHVSKI